jgi:hypothetical protein
MAATKTKASAAPKKMGRPRSDRDDCTAKIDRRIVGMAKKLAAFHGTTAAALLSEAARPQITKMWNSMLRASGGD